jgi:putative ABC transport system permease protein
MHWRDALLRIRALFLHRQMDEELEDELQFHVEMQTRKNLARGLAPQAARREARLQFGGVERSKEECRDARGINFVETLWRDFRYAVRSFRRTPGFTAIALLALVLGIGANTAIFSVVYAVLLEPLPYPHPEQLVMVWSTVNGNRQIVSAGDYLDWNRQNTVFQNVLPWIGGSFNLSTNGRPEIVRARICAPGLLDLQGIPFSLGRDFLAEEAHAGKDHVVVISHLLWQRRFGSDTQILGKQIRLDGEPYTVVGVLASGMPDRFESQIMVPLVIRPDQLGHDRRWLSVMARLKPGVSVQEANAEMDTIARRLASSYPASNKGWGVRVEPLAHDFTSPDTIKALWLLMGAVGFVLLIACVNVANLLLVRGATRHKEVAVRASLGATRGQIISQLLTESLALTLMGGILGIGFAWALLKAIMAILPPYSIPTEAAVRLSLPVLFFSCAATLLAGVLCGCIPAWQSAHWNLNDVLKEGGRGLANMGRHRVRRSLVVVEFALALTLLGGAGLVLHSFWKLERVDLGFRRDHLLTFALPVRTSRFANSEQMVAFYRELLQKIEAVPGVSCVSASTGMPMVGPGFGVRFSIAGEEVPDAASRPRSRFNMVTPEYFGTFGIPIVKGRAFNAQDTGASAPVAIVNETFAKKYFSGVDPLHERILADRIVAGAPGPWRFSGAAEPGPPMEWQVVGVSHDVHNSSDIRDLSFPEIAVPFWQSPWPAAAVAVRTTGDPGAVTNSIAATVQSMDPDLPLDRVRTMDQIVGESLADDRFATVFLAAFAAMALLLAGIGIYGVMSFAVAQRTHEIGVRMALGAGYEQVLRLVLGEGLWLATPGLLLGLSGAYLVGVVMKSLLFEVAPTDLVSIAAVSAVLLFAALLACYIPARRAARVDPLAALRVE